MGTHWDTINPALRARILAQENDAAACRQAARVAAIVAGAPPAPPARKPDTSAFTRAFLKAWNGIGGPALTAEHRFAPPRRWRFDFAHLDAKVAIELEGGVFTGGRHTRPTGFIADCEKYNAAAAAGWRVFRLATGMVKPPALQSVLQAIHSGA